MSKYHVQLIYPSQNPVQNHPLNLVMCLLQICSSRTSPRALGFFLLFCLGMQISWRDLASFPVECLTFLVRYHFTADSCHFQVLCCINSLETLD